MTANPSQLCAFYDLEVSGYDFDFIGFLILAERERRRGGFDSLHIVFVPEIDEGLHPRIHDADLRHWRLANMLIPACRLLPISPGFTACKTRDEAADTLEHFRERTTIFPAGYSVEAPIARWLSVWLQALGNMGESIQYLEATPNARAYIDGWADAQAGGGKIVTLTLRHAPYNPQRNSDLDVWSEVARRLADAGYTPVVVPDTEMALLPLPEEFGGMLQMPVVAFNIELRMALYEKAYANLFVSNGTAMLGMLNKRVRFVQFLSGEWIVDSQRVEKGSGIPYGHSYAYLNRFQHISWPNQDADKIIKIFAALARTIDAEGADHRDDLALEPDPGYRSR